MSWSRIKGILMQDLYVTRREVTVWFDLFIMAATSVVAFGFLSRYLGRNNSNPYAGSFVIMGMILWEVVRISQYSVTVGSLWNIWSQNLANIFVAPISLGEYVVANCLSSLVKTAAVTVVLGGVASLAFDFNILSLGLFNMTLILLNLTAFSWGLGWLLLGLIFRYGVRVQALAWSTIFVIQPLTAVYYPVSVLPEVVRWIAWCIPSTYALEAARRSYQYGGIEWGLHAAAFLTNVVWFVAGLYVFRWLFHRSRIVGQFARNDT